MRGYRVYTPGAGRRIIESSDVTMLDSMLLDSLVNTAVTASDNDMPGGPQSRLDTLATPGDMNAERLSHRIQPSEQQAINEARAS
jgi:hypothetical protein